MQKPILAVGNRISIRKVQMSDIPHLTGHDFSLSVVEPLGDFDRIKTVFSQTGFWQNERGVFVIIENQSNNILGTCQFLRSGPCIHGLELGYIVHDPKNRGKRFASEALLLASNWLFSWSESIHRQQLMIAITNTASWKVAENAGFVREGILRSSGFGVEPEDSYVYSRTLRDLKE